LALKKQNFAEGEIAIFDEACVYKRGEYWQFRLWLPKENKYARKSLRTRSESTAVERGKALNQIKTISQNIYEARLKSI